MAGSSFFALLDDIATILDDVSVMSKVAIKKTAGVLGDDLALNAEQVSGVQPDRELPVVWAVAKGSAINKLILVPLALAISYFIPWAVTPLLMVGGLYLCFEGAEKLAHKFLKNHREEAQHHKELVGALLHSKDELIKLEKSKIKGAIRTDFILSAEIIVIALGTVSEADLYRQLATLSTVAALMTIGVYGLVAGIVKLDDLGLQLSRSGGSAPASKLKQQLGNGILLFAPKMMRFIAILGMLAMFVVGGGILVHGIHPLHHFGVAMGDAVGQSLGSESLVPGIVGVLFNALSGVIAGALVVTLVESAKWLMRK